MSILKPSNKTSVASIKINIPYELADDLYLIKEQANSAGLEVDIDAALSKTLRRLVRSAKVELARFNLNHPDQQEKPGDAYLNGNIVI